MISVRLEQTLEKELTLVSKLNHQTKTETIKKLSNITLIP